MISTLSLVFYLAVLAVGKDSGDEQVRTFLPVDIIGCNKLVRRDQVFLDGCAYGNTPYFPACNYPEKIRCCFYYCNKNSKCLHRFCYSLGTGQFFYIYILVLRLMVSLVN